MKRILFGLMVWSVALAGCQSNQKSVSELQEDLKNPDWLISRSAADSLAQQGTNALSTLLGALKNKSPQTRMLAVSALVVFAQNKSTHSQALAELLQTLRDKHPLVRRRTAETLAAYARNPIDNDGLILALLESLRKDKDAPVRQYAARALGQLKVSIKNKSAMKHHVLAKLVAQLNDKNLLVVAEIANALLNLLWQHQKLIKEGTKEEIKALTHYQQRALQALIRSLQTGDSWTKAHVSRVLGSLGLRALPAIPALQKALLSSDPAVFHNAAAALGKLGEKAFQALEKDTKSHSLRVRIRAVYALSLMSDFSKKATRLLQKLSQAEREPRVKAMALFSQRVLKSRNKQ